VPTIALVDSYYPRALADFGLDRVLLDGTYSDNVERAAALGFGTGGAYTRNLQELGWDARILIPNALALQDLWTRENGVRRPWRAGWRYGPHIARLPIARSIAHRLPHLHGTLAAQIRRIRPDVLYVQDINLISPSLARELRRHVRLLVGEIASPLPPAAYLAPYDLIVSALPTIVDTARGRGIAAEWIPLGFDDRWAGYRPATSRSIDAVFVGSISRLQPTTVPLLRAVADRVPGLQIYGPGDPGMLESAGLRTHHHGPAWGSGMFSILGDSKIVVNRHGSIAGDFAVNMRMYEATGSGAALVTERKSNIRELFEPGTEIETYDTIDEAAEKTAQLLADPERLDRVAAAGQARTLRDHSYARRAERLTQVLDERLRGRSTAGQAR